MKKNKFEKATLFILVFISFGITIADVTSLIEYTPWLKDKIDLIILISIAALITHVLSDSETKNQELAHIVNGIHDNRSEIIRALSGIEVELFANSDDAFKYLTESVKNASISIDQVAIAPTPEIHSDILNCYLTSISDTAKIGNVRHRFVFGENYEQRSIRVKKWAKDNNNRRFFAKSYSKLKSSSVPILNFVIFDSELVFMRYPNIPGQKEIYIAVRHKAIKDVFEAYYERIWETASEV